MARKRLSAPFGASVEPSSEPNPLRTGESPAGEGWAPETKAMPFGPLSGSLSGSQGGMIPGRPASPSPAPIARVAGEASAQAALEGLVEEMTRARAGGRLIEPVPLDAVIADHLVRDRVGIDPEEMTALVESLRSHGQRMPVEVIDLGPAAGGRRRYGLISGGRRLAALRRLHAETGEPRFAHVLAVLRRPETAAEAYVAMVEENEVRASLSHYERARIVARAVEAGAFPDRAAALRALHATASRAKRSKIGSFLVLVDALDGVLRFPAAIPERLGLALAARLEETGFAARLVTDLAADPAPDAAAEAMRLAAALRPKDAGKKAQAAGRNVARGIRMTARPDGGILLTGPGVDDDFRARLEEWLRKG